MKHRLLFLCLAIAAAASAAMRIEVPTLPQSECADASDSTSG